jgi:eukaryotic-like serine/threonine-protein kinase
VPASGGTPREVAGFTGAHLPVWAGNDSLIVLASRAATPVASTYDWWMVPVSGGEPSATGAYELMRSAGINPSAANIGPDDWRDGRVLFSDFSSVWSLHVDRTTGRATDLDRLTIGTNADAQPASAGSGLIVFSSASEANNVWAVPIDANRGVITGSPRNVTAGTGFDARPSAAADGQTVAYHSRTPRQAVLIKNLRTGAVTDLGVAGSNFGPAISADGSLVAYEEDDGVNVISTHGGSPRTLCRSCGIGDWSDDGRSLLVTPGNQRAVGALASIDVESGSSRNLVESPDRPLNRPFLSPDGRWLAFRLNPTGATEAIVIATVSDRPAASSQWTKVVPDEADVRPCGWSPDGTLLYFVSSRDGTRCLYAVRIDRKTGGPQGDPIAVRHFHGARNVWAGVSGVLSTGPGNAVRGGVFMYDVGQYTANVWTMTERR